ncbi:MAG: 4-alpha-glucanotransferase [Actinomycetota bacterium]|nr:4-alpha-glucanotransferase [Actinomycetota bacterium]
MAGERAAMNEADLVRRAGELGVAVSYQDWRGRPVQVQGETLRAIVAALDGATGTAPIPPPGTAPVPADARPARPAARSWGFTVQLYAVRSRHSWGHGDLRDLADLATWSARGLGASFIGINPLHAAEPGCPVSNSPYLPMTRRYISPLYLRIEDVEEFGRLPALYRQHIEQLADPLRAVNTTPDLIDRDRVWTAKREALELLHRVPRSGQREAAYRRFTEREGAELADWASWCAIAEVHGPDWRRWPADLASPRRAAAQTGPGGPLAPRAEFFAWLQWLAGEQLAAAQRAARAAGMAIGVIGDLAVGVHPGGADAWAHQDLLVGGMSVGAPPDEFNQRGQDWGQPPWHPQRLAAAGAAPLADLLRAALRDVGGLRVDHVMGLLRLWWIPAGMSPERGAYVSYDHRLMVGALAAEAARAGAVAVGEDLGTVEPWIRRYLSDQHILGTEMAWFARDAGGRPLPPGQWRKDCMATVGTHDVPPVSGFVSGDQVAVRAALGLLTDADAERRAADRAIGQWREVLTAERLLPSGRVPTAAEFTVALYGHLARTPAVLIGVSLADAVGDRRTQNIPGTVDEYPNWRVPLCDGAGRSVLVEDLPSVDLVAAVAAAVGGRAG